MADENDELEQEDSSENKKSPSKRYIIEKVLDSYLSLLDEVQDISDTVDELDTDLNKNKSDLNSEINKLENEVVNNKTQIDANYDDFKRKVLDLIEITKSRASKNHTHKGIDDLHDETEEINSKISELIDEDEELASEIEELSNNIRKIEYNIDELEKEDKRLYEKLTQVAHNHILLKKNFSKFLEVQDLKNEAHKKSTYKAKCDECNESINILSLKESKCPNCDEKFTNIKSNRIFPNILEVSNDEGE